MEKNIEKRAYIKPEAELITLCFQENIATSEPVKTYDDEFNGEDDVFD